MGMCSILLFLRWTGSKLEKPFPFDPDKESAMMIGPVSVIIKHWGYFNFLLYFTYMCL